jgi:hypothetical protein
MQSPVVYIDTSAIREGKIEELKRAMKSLTEFVEENNPHLLSYQFFLNADQNQMTVVALHPDSKALQFHLQMGAGEFGEFATLIELERIEVYGAVSAAVLEQLQQKAENLGGGTVAVHEFFAGFVR